MDPSGWTELASQYNRDNMRLYNKLLRVTWESMRDLQDDPELVSHFAQTACAISVGLRSVAGIDLGTLTMPMIEPPFPPNHPFKVLLPLLDATIETHLEWLAGNRSGDPALPFNYAKFHAALVWKGYLYCLTTEPRNWGTGEHCALKVLRIFSTADHSSVIEGLQQANDAAIRDHVRPEDWPPREFIRIYFAHRDQIMSFVPIF